MASVRAGQARLPESLEDLENLTDLAEIQRALDALIDEEASLESQITELIQRSPFVEAQIKVIRDIPEQLEPLLADVSRLDDSLREVSRVADEISFQVRQLDQLNTKINTAIRKTDDIIDLKNCIDGVQNAMASEDFGAAAQFINRYLNFDKSILDRASVDLLETAEKNLADIIRLKCDSAISANDTEAVFKFALLMPLIGKSTLGIEKISIHFSKLLAKDEQAIYQEMEKTAKADNIGSDQKVSYAAAISQLLQRLERRLKRYRGQLESSFGRVGLAQLLINVQTHVNERGHNLLESFIREWQLQSTLNNINRQSSSRSNAGLSTALSRGASSIEYRDPREYAPLLDQIVIISQSFEVYHRFSSYLIAAPTHLPSPSADPTAIPNLVSQLRRSFYQSKLNERMHEVLGWYVRLEQYYIDEAAKMAIVEDQLPEFASEVKTAGVQPMSSDEQRAPSQQMISSIVDDVFFVVRECLQRAQMTYNVNTICAIINLADQQLGSLFLDTLAHNSKLASSIQATLSRKTATPLSVTVALNNLERLREEMETSIKKQFANEAGEVQKITAVLDDIHQTEKRFSHILHGNMELLASSVLPRLQTSLENRLTEVNYVLTEEQYTQNQINDPFMMQLVNELDASVATFVKYMTDANCELLHEILARSFAEQIESHLLLQAGNSTYAIGSSSTNEHAELKRFNLLGAQQLDRDIRNLLGYFTAQRASKSVREKFVRINQMTFLLNLEKEVEVLDYWGSKASEIAWRLSPSEVRRILALRIDFNREAIVKLKL